VFSVDVNTDCHPGIYLATKDWLAENYPNQPLVRCRCRKTDVLKAGDKFRCKRLEVLKEKRETKGGKIRKPKVKLKAKALKRKTRPRT
jgi:hypothetical protein